MTKLKNFSQMEKSSTHTYLPKIIHKTYEFEVLFSLPAAEEANKIIPLLL